ncbi:DNA polymerase III subunit delta' [Roseospira goensis]|uniref:DNA polymerase-3 subunit delta n=1 Tax=Roseospira goensis TaxID=391922 RepID=A0A7W6RWW6_9PROT|nr:DNA polymerase III subunit delta' [Roseospira goensis]MBB4284738.1 DNA polymerase-3 subunit delta' [Roseospira goensis]
MARASSRGRGRTLDPADLDPAPRANPHLAGQAAAEGEVLRAWTGGRMSHAWLISGPRGIGKATLAFRMARFVLADGGGAGQGGDGPGLFGDATPAPTSLTMAPDHPVFHRVQAASHADLRVIQRAPVDETEAAAALGAGREPRRRGEIGVDSVRGLGAFLSLTPAEGGWRVVVIDAADEMNRNAANAVLKVLEEPPRRAILLLVAHNPARLPSTIASRCRRLTLRPLAPDVMTDLLMHYRPDLDESARATLVRLAGGSIGRALGLARQGGLDLHGELLAVLGQAPHMDVARCHALGDAVARDDAAWQLLRDLLPGWLAGLARFGATGQGAADGETAAEDRALMTRLCRAAPLDRWVAVWEKTVHLLGRTEAVNLDRKQAVLAVLLLIERAAARA